MPRSRFIGATPASAAIFLRSSVPSSGIGWADPQNTVALTLSHPGQQRAEAGRFREYEFTRVYRIDRMRDGSAGASHPRGSPLRPECR